MKYQLVIVSATEVSRNTIKFLFVSLNDGYRGNVYFIS